MERNPNHPLYQFEVFHTPAFKKYAEDLRAHLQRSQQENLVPRTVKEMMPDVAHGVTLPIGNTSAATGSGTDIAWP